MAKRRSPEEVLLHEHLAEMGRAGAEPYNLGWAEGEGFIHSKTSKGRLFTERKGSGVRHEWTEARQVVRRIKRPRP